MSKRHCKSFVVFIVYHSQKCVAVVTVTGGDMQEEGNRFVLTNDRDGEVFTALSWTVGQGQYSVEGIKQFTVCLTFFVYIIPLPFFVSSLIYVFHF